jgi:hypothetical protein
MSTDYIMELSCKGYATNQQPGINSKPQLVQINKNNIVLEDMTRQNKVKKSKKKHNNPSKLRYMIRKTKPKINRKNGVNRCYTF